MPISHDFRFIHVHVPRCGGTSINSALNSAGAKVQLEGRASPHQREQFKQVMLQHIPAMTLASFDESVWRQYFKFAFVRNPWDMLVSLYHYNSQNIAKKTPSSAYAPKIDQIEIERFQTWARFVCRANPGRKRGASYYITDSSGKSMMDFVGRFERLAEDFEYVCSIIGIHANLPHINSSAHANYRNYYNDQVEAIVKEAYVDDIRNFGYSF